MSIYYNPQMMRLLNEERLQEIMRDRAVRPPEDRPARASRREETRLPDGCLARASTSGAAC